MKRMLPVAAGLAPVLLVAGALALAPPSRAQNGNQVNSSQVNNNHGNDDGDNSRVQQGFAIAPVPLNLRGKNRALVGLGSYLVNAVGGCNDCHTNPSYVDGGDPFLGQPKQVNAAGYLAGGQTFGPFVSRNLTPDTHGLPAGLTWPQFATTIRTGHDFDCAPGAPPPCPLLQVMPWPTYQDMVERDLRAIYEYLRAIPSLPTPPGA
ncbi:MAG: cytochrome C [Rhodanobacteraceae bacterium]|jgi:hypothetical protein|nr:cytochrome C [Rhodanobacteraceae bacterium]